MAKQDLELLYPHKCIEKIYLHVEEFSLKTNWGLAEGLPYNENLMKYADRIGQGGKRCDQVRTCVPRRRLGEKGACPGDDLLWGVSGLSHTLDALVLGSDKGEMGPPGRLEGQQDPQENCRKPGLHHLLACSRSRAEWADGKLLGRLPAFQLLSQHVAQSLLQSQKDLRERSA